MSLTFRAVYEKGVLTPLEKIPLKDHQEVHITLELNVPDTADSSDETLHDPLAGIRASTGITDLAKNFDDYRFRSDK